MFGLQPLHILLIIVVAALFFVPSRLPELARSLRKTIPAFREGLKEAPLDESKDKPEPPKA